MANCVQCGGDGAGKDQLCGACRLSAYCAKQRKYHWTPELVRQLQLAYTGSRTERSRKLTELSHRTGWPKSALSQEAQRRGIAFTLRRWSDEDKEFLRKNAGVLSAAKIAKRLGRTREAVEGELELLKTSHVATEGYTETELMACFGVTRSKVQGWVRRGLFGKVEQVQGYRVEEQVVVRFVRRYPNEYGLLWVNQEWFKKIVFGHLAGTADLMGDEGRAEQSEKGGTEWM